MLMLLDGKKVFVAGIMQHIKEAHSLRGLGMLPPVAIKKN